LQANQKIVEFQIHLTALFTQKGIVQLKDSSDSMFLKQKIE
jgi:hypothetical protein